MTDRWWEEAPLAEDLASTSADKWWETAPLADSPSFGDSLRRGVDVAQSFAGGAVEATGELVGSEALTGFGRDVRERNIAEAETHGPRTTFTEIRGPGGFGRWLKQVVGEQIPVIVPSLAGGAAGAGIGALGGPTAPVTVPLGAAIGALIPSFLLGTGEVQATIKEQDPDAEAPAWAFAGGTAVAALDSILPGKVGTRLARAVGLDMAEQIAKRTLQKPVKQAWVKRTAKGAASGVATEGITEALQEAVAEVAASQGTGQPIDLDALAEQMVEAGAAGAVMGGAVGGGSAAISRRRPAGEREKATAAPPEITPDDEASPIPNEVIAEGRRVLRDAGAITGADRILEAAGFPTVGTRVTVAMPDGGRAAGEITDAYADDTSQGARIELDDGGVLAEDFAVLRGRVFPEDVVPEAGAAQPSAEMRIGQAVTFDDGPGTPGQTGRFLGLNEAGSHARVRTAAGERLIGIRNLRTASKQTRGPVEPEASPPREPILRTDGRPFRSEKAAALAVRARPDLQNRRLRPVQVDGGFGLAPAVGSPLAPPSGSPQVAPGEVTRPSAPTPGRGLTRPQATQPTGVAATETIATGTATRPIVVDTAADTEAAARQVEPEPTPARAEAGNFRMGHIRLHDLDVTIEVAKGGTRRGRTRDGTPWEVTDFPVHYGYIKGTEARDGDHVDVFVGDNPESEKAFVVDQVNPQNGRFDEHKLLIGFGSRDEAIAGYDASYADDASKRRKAVTETTVDDLKAWLEGGDKNRPFAEAAAQRRLREQIAPTRGEEGQSGAQTRSARGLGGPGARYVPLVETQEAGRKAEAQTAADTGKPITRESVLRPLVKALDLPVYQGRVKGKGTLGFARPGSEEVRLKRRSDLEVAAHEFAHILDFRFKEIRRQWSPPSKSNKAIRDELRGVSYDRRKLFEGFAEFVRLWATQKGEAKARAPKFSRWFEGFLDRNEHGEALRQAQKDFNAWFEQDPLTRARSKVGLNENVNAVLDDSLSGRFRQAVVDDLHGILVAERTIYGDKLAGGAYETARLARSARSITAGAVRWGAPRMDDKGRLTFIDADGNPATVLERTDAGGSRAVENPAYKPWGLEKILAPVADELDRFGMYAIGRRAQHLAGQDRENLFTPAEIKAMVALETPTFRQVFADWNKFNKQLLDFAQEFGGVISPLSRPRWESDVYLPFWRVSAEKGKHRPGQGKGGAVKLINRLHGGTENLGDPIENMFRNTALLIETSILANARRSVVDEVARAKGSARFLAKIPKDSKTIGIDREDVERRFWEQLGLNYSRIKAGQVPVSTDPATVATIRAAFDGQSDFMRFVVHGQAPAGANVIAVMRNGRSEFYEVADPLLYRALASLPRRTVSGPMINTLRAFRRVGQVTITHTVDFWYRNIVRDQAMAGVLSRHGYRPFVDAARGLKKRFSEDATYREYIANGGGLASLYGDDASIHRELETFYKQHSIPYELVVNSPRKMLRMLERFADAFEVATRLGYFERALETGTTPREAAYLSREISTDFAMRGSGLPGDHPLADRWDDLSRTLGVLYDSVIFLKAGVIGVDRTYRGLVSDPNRVRVALKTGGIAMAGLTLWAFNRGNPLFDDLEDWDRETHWHVFVPRMGVDPDAPLKDHYWHFRIPRPWEIGGIAAIVERAVEGYVDAQPAETGKATLRIIRELFRFEFIPQAIQPLYEQATNRIAFFDRPIESQAEQSLPPWMRAQGTSETMRRFGRDVIRRLPREVQVSPSRIEALLKAYFHTAAIYGLTLSDAIFFDDAPDMRIDQYPLIRSIYREEPRSRYQSELYDLLRDATEARRSVRKLYRQNEPALAAEAALSDENLQYGRLNAAAGALQNLTSLQRRVADARSMDTLRALAREIDRGVEIPKQTMLRIKQAKDIGAMKREMIDALSAVKRETSKQAVEDAEGMRQNFPTLREQVRKMLPVGANQ